LIVCHAHESTRYIERVQPRFIELMYAEAVSKLPEGDDCSYEPKLDGDNCLAAKSTDRVVLWSRRGNFVSQVGSLRSLAPARIFH
jgi:ATP-dependent DNA ligase